MKQITAGTVLLAFAVLCNNATGNDYSYYIEVVPWSSQSMRVSLHETIILTFENCKEGSVEYDIPSINRQGTVPIQRVANDNIALCRQLALKP